MTIPPPGPAKQLWACVHLTGCTRDKAALDPKGVAVLPGGAFHPPRQARTKRGPPYGAPWQQTGAHGFLATRKNPLDSSARAM
jgi:hypothetical protein